MFNSEHIETLAILAIFRNEAVIMEEWIQHHINEGVDHFYLINNSSTDNYSEILDKYKGKITLYQHDKLYNVDLVEITKGGQTLCYEEVLPNIKEDWLYTVDMDEFAYVRKPYNNIKDLLIKEGHKFDQIAIKLKQFTSSGLIKQPDSVVDSFTTRWDHNAYFYLLGKCIARTKKITNIDINISCLEKGCITVDASLNNVTDFFTLENRRIDFKVFLSTRNTYLNSTEKSISNDIILSNHYSIQSKEWFWNVKAKRGVVASLIYMAEGTSMEQVWQEYWSRVEDRVILDDFELKDIKRKK